MIEAKILMTYRRDLTNLSIQESRLRRNREKDLAALKELQNARQKEARKRLQKIAVLYIEAVEEGTQEHFDPTEFGFEFSLEEIEVCAIDLCPTLFAEYEKEREQEHKQRRAA